MMLCLRYNRQHADGAEAGRGCNRRWYQWWTCSEKSRCRLCHGIFHLSRNHTSTTANAAAQSFFAKRGKSGFYVVIPSLSLCILLCHPNSGCPHFSAIVTLTHSITPFCVLHMKKNAAVPPSVFFEEWICSDNKIINCPIMSDLHFAAFHLYTIILCVLGWITNKKFVTSNVWPKLRIT